MSLKICIDPGHEGCGKGLDPGAVNGSKREATATLAIAKKVGALLKSKGHQVKFTRTKDKFLSLQERCDISNDFDANVFVSIHLNAAANKDATGIETWRHRNVGAKTKKLADTVQTELIRVLGWKNRGVKETTSLFVLQKTKASAVLVECGFISNNEESRLLFIERYQDKLAQAIADGVLKAFA